MVLHTVKKVYYPSKVPPFAPQVVPYQGEGVTVRRQEVVGYNGDEAVALAVKQSKVDVVAAYPITPQTIIVERFSEYVADGEVDTEFVCLESEHSAASASIGASLTGARVFTATASQGLALMHEVLYTASGLRCPIVMAVANRALSAPLNIHNDRSDMMGSRDCGWIQIYAENSQEAYDWTIQAFKIAENTTVQLPVTVNFDGFVISHAMETINTLADEDVTGFLPSRKPIFTIDPEHPVTVGSLFLQEYYFEIKRQQEEALQKSAEVVDQVAKEYCALSGREYGILETCGMEDAEAAILCMGSTAGTARSVMRKMRAEGKKVGLIKLWLYRPFPVEEIISALGNVKALAIMDMALSFGAPVGALCSDIATILQLRGNNLKIFDVIYGLGGRDIRPAEIEGIFNEALSVAQTGIVKESVKYVGVRE
ncbi:MAG: pyruvate ferredoxin oxidoreductase alpha subunit [Thermoproteota archaeon]|nr:pyruvate ferredoxin oxidoreductase alpha subunit [Thermoproteota archaeon]